MALIHRKQVSRYFEDRASLDAVLLPVGSFLQGQVEPTCQLFEHRADYITTRLEEMDSMPLASALQIAQDEHLQWSSVTATYRDMEGSQDFLVATMEALEDDADGFRLRVITSGRDEARVLPIAAQVERFLDGYGLSAPYRSPEAIARSLRARLLGAVKGFVNSAAFVGVVSGFAGGVGGGVITVLIAGR